MPTKNWTTLFEQYKGKWVALADDETTVISSGEVLSEVIHEATDKGHLKPILAKVPIKDVTYIGLA